MSRAAWALAQALLILVTLMCVPVAAGTAEPYVPGLWNPNAQLDNSRVHSQNP